MGPPTRRQKRWSGRLRTAGALLSLLGAVAVADSAVGLASPIAATSPLAGQSAPLIVGVTALVSGAVCYWLGRRWRGI